MVEPPHTDASWTNDEAKVLAAWTAPLPDPEFAAHTAQAWIRASQSPSWLGRLRRHGRWPALIVGVAAFAWLASRNEPTVGHSYDGAIPGRAAPLFVLGADATVPEAPPQQGTPRGDRPAIDVAPIAPLIDEHVSAYGRFYGEAFAFSGVVRVRRGASVLFERGYGHDGAPNPQPLRADAQLPLGSFSQVLTAAAVLHAVEAGTLALDTSLSDLWPQVNATGNSVTIAELLEHRSGILASIRFSPLNPRTWRFAAGERGEPSPSHEGYGVLAQTLERAAERPWDEVIEGVFENPEGLHVQPQGDERAARGRTFTEGEVELLTPLELPGSDCAGTCAALGHAAAVDAVFSTLLGDTTISRALVDRELMLAPRGHGALLESTGEGEDTVVSASGGMLGANMHVLRHAHDDLTVVVLANTDVVDARKVAKNVLAITQGHLVPLPHEKQELRAGSPIATNLLAGRYALTLVQVGSDPSAPPSSFVDLDQLATIDIAAKGPRIRLDVPRWGEKWLYPFDTLSYFAKDQAGTEVTFTLETTSQRVRWLRIDTGDLRLWYGPKGRSDEKPAPQPTNLVPRIGPGLDADIIRRIIRAHGNEVRFCYNEGLRREPTLWGVVAIAFTIDARGRVPTAEVSTTTLEAAPDVASCIANAVKRWYFPKPSAPWVEVEFPFVLEGGDVRGLTREKTASEPPLRGNPSEKARL